MQAAPETVPNRILADPLATTTDRPDRSTEPLPVLNIRIVLFTVANGALQVSLHGDGPPYRLHGGLPRTNTALDPEARRLLRESTGLREEYLEQLYTLSVPAADGWRVIVAYLGLVATVHGAPPSLSGSWHNVVDLPPLAPPDQQVIDYGALRLRAKLGYTTIAFHLLPPTFTLSELQGAYESILGHHLDKRNFRRRILAADFLTSTGETRRVGSHRPALLYQFRAAHDRETYLTPAWVEGAP